MEIQIREQRLPGIGHRYELGLEHDRRALLTGARFSLSAVAEQLAG